MSKDYYKILGVTEFNTAEEIKIAYRKLARKLHPDIIGNSSDNILKFKEINEAYEILSNKIKKEEYDKARSFYNYAKEGSKTYNKNSYTTSTSSNNHNHTNFDWKSFFNNSQNSAKKTNIPQRGEDIESEIELTFSEAIDGCTKIINLLKTDVCEQCNGRKFINGTYCSKCKGKGEFTTHKKFNVKIPAGIKENSKIRLAGEGNCGKFGGPNGDIYLKIKIKKNSTSNSNDLNIYKTIVINPSEAIFGTEVKINCSDNNIIFSIPANTKNGQTIKLSKCGNVQNNKIGDMIITVEIQIPSNLSKEELDLYKKLLEISKNKESYYDR